MCVFRKGLVVSTQQSYHSGQVRYLAYSRQANVRAVPACESVWCLLVSFQEKEKLKHGTFTTIHFLHLKERAKDPFKPSLHQLEYVLKGIKR